MLSLYEEEEEKRREIKIVMIIIKLFEKSEKEILIKVIYYRKSTFEMILNA